MIIINGRGETVQVLPQVKGAPLGIRLQTCVKFDMLTIPTNGWPPRDVTSELILSKREGMALLLKLADRLGVAIEVNPNPRGLMPD